MSWRYRDWEPTRPIRRQDGIRAQTQHGAFGKTWWAGRWIATLEQLVDPGRLSRGRSYARNGQVLTLDVGPDGVAAQVQGSRPKPYHLTIRFRHLSDAEWEQVVDAMAAEALYAARLLSGEMPERVEDAFAAAGASLFPASAKDLVAQCSCPDWSNPCKHVAAVHYLLGERFDADPFLIFLLRGRSKDEVIAAPRARRADGAGRAGEADGGDEVDEAAAPREQASAGDFWTLPPAVEDLAVSFTPPATGALAVKRVGPPPFTRDPQAFTRCMEAAYQAISAHARRLIDGEA